MVKLQNPPPGRAGSVSINIDLNRRLLNRYRFVAQESMRLLAGWVPHTATFEIKCEFARTLWEYSQHVQALYLRLREIQSPAFQTPDDAALVTLMREFPHAPDEFALAAALYRVLVPSLIAAMTEHETTTFPNSDQPSVYVITHALLDLKAQQRRGATLLRQSESAGRITRKAKTWERYIRRLLAAAGGVSGAGRRQAAPPLSPVREQFVLPRAARRDRRFTHLHADLAAMPAEEDYRDHTTTEFTRYSTEMLAAETVAHVLYTLPKMPWEFQFDAARHLYDEVRHCLMGFEWMRTHRLNPFASPQYLHVYRWRSQFPPVMQYCLLTMGNEVNAFPYRHRRVDAHQRAGDALSEQFVRYDIADETQHVRFGKRWLPELLKHVGEKRPLEKYVKDVLKVWESEYRTGKLTVNVE